MPVSTDTIEVTIARPADRPVLGRRAFGDVDVDVHRLELRRLHPKLAG